VQTSNGSDRETIPDPQSGEINMAHPRNILDADTSSRVNSNIMAILADGQWHPYSELIAAVSCIPPETASRLYLNSIRKTDRDKRQTSIPLDARILKGKMVLLNHRIRDLKNIETQGLGFERKVRLSNANPMA